jgi:hypothetical protein
MVQKPCERLFTLIRVLRHVYMCIVPVIAEEPLAKMTPHPLNRPSTDRHLRYALSHAQARPASPHTLANTELQPDRYARLDQGGVWLGRDKPHQCGHGTCSTAEYAGTTSHYMASLPKRLFLFSPGEQSVFNRTVGSHVHRHGLQISHGTNKEKGDFGDPT